MAEENIPEEIRSKAAAAAEAVYRLSEAVNFDPALKFELRKMSAGILSRVAGLALGFGFRRREEIQELLADAVAIQELIRFAAARLYIIPQNAERVLAAYSRIGSCLAEIDAAENTESVHIALGIDEAPRVYTRGISAESAEAYPLRQGFGELPAPHSSAGLRPRFSPASPRRSRGRAAKMDKANLNERQSRIMEFLASNGRVQIGDIRQIFGETASEKTLQRDLWQLANSGLIRRHGDNRWTTYSLGH